MNEVASSFYPILRKPWNRKQTDRIRQAWKAVQWRETTRKRDEFICLSNLLDVDFDPSWEDHEISTKFIDSLGESIPAGFIFIAGKKLEKIGYRWAPASWMTGLEIDFPDPLFLPSKPVSLLASGGLVVQYPGIKLHFFESSKHERFWVPMSRDLSLWYHVENADGEMTDIQSQSNSDSSAIILCRPNPGKQREIALLVNIMTDEQFERDAGLNTKTESDFHIATPNRRVWVNLEEDLQVIQRLRAAFLERQIICWGEELSVSQKWCVI